MASQGSLDTQPLPQTPVQSDSLPPQSESQPKPPTSSSTVVSKQPTGSRRRSSSSSSSTRRKRLVPDVKDEVLPPVDQNVEEVPAKRKRMSVACLGCRARKIKCDGRKPKCLNCELYRDECMFVFHNDKRKPYPKEYIDALTSRISVLESLLTKANIDFNTEVPEPQPKLSEGTSTETTVIEKSKVSEDYIDRLTDRVGQLSMTNIGLRYFGPTSNLHLLSSIIWTRRPNSNIEFKGRAAVEAAGLNYDVDPAKRDHLLNLYWTWHHPFFNVTEKSLFLRDMELYNNGMASHAKYYSPLLLNAFLASASLLDDNYSDSEVFHLKARILIDIEVEEPRITTVQAAAVLGAYEGVCDRDTRGWIYTGMSIRMAVDMGYHINCDSWVKKNIITAEEAHMRKITFWGCFVFDRLWSFYMGRPASIRLDDVPLDRPSEADARPEDEKEAWVPYVSPTTPLSSIWTEYTAPVRLNSCMVYLVKLIEMIAEIQEIMYSGTEGLPSDLWSFASNMYVRLTSWYTTLPSPLLCSPNSQKPVVSHVVVLHLQYHAALILLHRPFLKMQGSVISSNHATDVCRTAATTITNLLEKYRTSWYSMRRINVISVHIIFTAATVHLLNAWGDIGTYKANATHGLKVCCLALSELGSTYETAKRTLAVITCLLGKGRNGPSAKQVCGTEAPRLVFTNSVHTTETKWKPEIQRTRPFQSALNFSTPDDLDLSLKFPNNSKLKLTPFLPWESHQNPTMALRESENEKLDDYPTSLPPQKNAETSYHDNNCGNIFDHLIQTTSGRLPTPQGLQHLLDSMPSNEMNLNASPVPTDWNYYLQSVESNKSSYPKDQ